MINDCTPMNVCTVYKYKHTVADDRTYTDNSDCTGHAPSHDRKYQDLSAGINQSDYWDPVRGTVSPVT